MKETTMKHLCSYPSCGCIIDNKGFCQEHKHLQQVKVETAKPFSTATRSSPELYATTRWKKIRKLVLTRDKHQCIKCGSTIKLSIHHVIPHKGSLELFYNVDNLITLCKTCHNAITGKHTHTFRSRN